MATRKAEAGGVKPAAAVKRKLLVITKTIRSWSYSRIRDWEACGYFGGLKHALGLKEPGNQAMARGSAIGKLAELYVKGEIVRLPPELANFYDEFKLLRAAYKKNSKLMAVEDNWAFRADWSETHTKDWDGARCRIKMDVSRLIKEPKGWLCTPIDHKTGKYSPKYEVQSYLDQLELYALGCLIKYGKDYPGLRVRGELWFLDHGITHPADREYTMADLPDLKASWEARAARMMADRRFVPVPSRRCEWCFFRASNGAEGGGQCIH